LRLALLQTILLSAAAIGPAAAAQPNAATAPAAGDLKIVVIEGEGARNNIRSQSATSPVIEVRDQADKPVPGAEVVFQLPASGPGAVFWGWMRTQTLRTDEKGRAVASGMTPNQEEGRFQIRVLASSDGKKGSAVINQINYRGGNAERAGQRQWWKYAVAIGVAGGIAGGIAAARGATTTITAPAAQPVPVTISPGAISVGAPR